MGNKIQQAIKKLQLGNHEREFHHKVISNWEDARIDLFKVEWFKDKRILDIGCNTGIVDLLIAAKFTPKLIIGTDIDHRMITKAIKNM